jgi:hypothetical protein
MSSNATAVLEEGEFQQVRVSIGSLLRCLAFNGGFWRSSDVRFWAKAASAATKHRSMDVCF